VSSVITIDANELDEAAPRVAELHQALGSGAAALDGVNLGVEMPDGLAGVVAGEVSAIAADMRRAASSIVCQSQQLAQRADEARLADQISTRAGDARLADQISTLANAFAATALPADLISAAGKNGAKYGVPAGVARAARAAGAASFAAAGVMAVGAGLYKDLRDPDIDTQRRIVNTGVRLATNFGLPLAAAGVAALAFPALPAVGVAATAGLTWMVLDEQFGLTDKVSDVADAGVDALGDAAGKIGDAFRW
jgi:hypothetical protein